MVRKLKKPIPKKSSSAGDPTWWLVGFDAQGDAGIFVHKHGDTDDHSGCGPVVMCCERARPAYQKLAPEMCARVSAWRPQDATHLASWFAGGLQAMYFVLCDRHDEGAVYQFGLPREQALQLLHGRVKQDEYRRPEFRIAQSGA